MKPFALAFVLAMFCVAGTAAQSPTPAETAGSEASLAGGTVINAELNSSIDSKKAKPGEQITAHTTEAVRSPDCRGLLPKGTELLGRGPQASPRFQRPGGAQMALHFVQAGGTEREESSLEVLDST